MQTLRGGVTGFFTFGLTHQHRVRLHPATALLRRAGRLVFLLGQVFLLVTSFEFLKPFYATVYKGIQACVHFLGCSLGFRTFEDSLLPDTRFSQE